MAVLTVQTIDEDGLVTAAYAAAAAGGDSFPNDGRTFVHVKNGGAQITVTITPRIATSSKTGFGPVALTTQVVTIAATTGDVMIGPFPPLKFNDQVGRVSLTYSGVTTVTIAAYKLPEHV